MAKYLLTYSLKHFVIMGCHCAALVHHKCNCVRTQAWIRCVFSIRDECLQLQSNVTIAEDVFRPVFE